MSVHVTPLLLLEDNYCYFIKDSSSGLSAVIDPSEATPIVSFLEKENNNKLDYILNTHHHWDHVNGNLELKQKYNCNIVGSFYDLHRTPGLDTPLKDNEIFHLGETAIKALHVPGHTSGQLAFWIEGENILFTGDTLFSLGCGRLFEGSAEQMVQSLNQLKSLPPETQVYFGHEYTANNVSFALSLEPKKPELIAKQEQIQELRKKNLPTTPTTLSEELQLNPFLRCNDQALKGALKLDTATETEVFAKIRTLKDHF